MWRLSRSYRAQEDPSQGWKLHISATVLSAGRVLAKVAPLLRQQKILFKAPRTLENLEQLNSGLYGFSQIGKFITVYPPNAADAVSLAQRLHRLTRRFPAPIVPYDIRYKSSGSVYYRYGAFDYVEIENSNGTRTPVIKDARGNPVADRREDGSAVPPWVINPFPPPKRDHVGISNNDFLRTKIRAFDALSQRGKGGVYRAIDTSVRPVRLCILKEGRKHGETGWDGRDGYLRLKREERALAILRQNGVRVPRLYSSFHIEGDYYLAMEFLAGENLHLLLMKRRKGLPAAQALRYALQLARIMRRIHAAGWVWRDCKPLNIIVSPKGVLRPLDFEGACRVERPDASLWATAGYLSPQSSKHAASRSSAIAEDLYALGVTLHQMFSGQISGAAPHAPLDQIKRKIPRAACEIVTALLNPDPLKRPPACLVAKTLAADARRKAVR